MSSYAAGVRPENWLPCVWLTRDLNLVGGVDFILVRDVLHKAGDHVVRPARLVGGANVPGATDDDLGQVAHGSHEPGDLRMDQYRHAKQYGEKSARLACATFFSCQGIRRQQHRAKKPTMVAHTNLGIIRLHAPDHAVGIDVLLLAGPRHAGEEQLSQCRRNDDVELSAVDHDLVVGVEERLKARHHGLVEVREQVVLAVAGIDAVRDGADVDGGAGGGRVEVVGVRVPSCGRVGAEDVVVVVASGDVVEVVGVPARKQTAGESMHMDSQRRWSGGSHAPRTGRRRR